MANTYWTKVDEEDISSVTGAKKKNVEWGGETGEAKSRGYKSYDDLGEKGVDKIAEREVASKKVATEVAKEEKKKQQEYNSGVAKSHAQRASSGGTGSDRSGLW